VTRTCQSWGPSAWAAQRSETDRPAQRYARLSGHLPAARVALGLVVVGMSSGCQLLPPNYLALIAADPAGQFPAVLRFTEGAAWESGQRGVALLRSPKAVLLFDYRGGANRVHLLFRQDRGHRLYERIGQRSVVLSSAGATGSPAGIRTSSAKGSLRGSIDVFVERSEREDAQATALFEHYPRALRLVGFFALPRRIEASDESASPGFSLWQRHAEADWVADFADHAGEHLDELPIIDAQYLVPTTLLDRLVRRTP
jgi:hypothetical protein